ncbi:hypothetical protein WJX77_010546 [Trebouxia sp. C0004]
MVEPVIVAEGHTYERAAMQHWLHHLPAHPGPAVPPWPCCPTPARPPISSSRMPLQVSAKVHRFSMTAMGTGHDTQAAVADLAALDCRTG